MEYLHKGQLTSSCRLLNSQLDFEHAIFHPTVNQADSLGELNDTETYLDLWRTVRNYCVDKNASIISIAENSHCSKPLKGVYITVVPRGITQGEPGNDIVHANLAHTPYLDIFNAN